MPSAFSFSQTPRPTRSRSSSSSMSRAARNRNPIKGPQSPTFRFHPAPARNPSNPSPVFVVRSAVIFLSAILLMYFASALFNSRATSHLSNLPPPRPVVKPRAPYLADAIPVVDPPLQNSAPDHQQQQLQDKSPPSVARVPSPYGPRRSRANAFMVVFVGHSGSTAFITEMRNHPEFEIEFLEPVDHGEYEHDVHLALSHIRGILDRAAAKKKIAGFKIRPYHLRHATEEWKKLIRDYDIRIFWQFRVNVFKQAIGEYRHLVLNDTSVVEGLKSNEKACDKKSGYQCRFRIDNITAVHDLMNTFSVNDEYLGEAVRLLKRDDAMMAVRYEDYLYRREQTMRNVMDFLGVDYRETSSLRSKASLDSMCDMVINYQEVCGKFYSCQLWRPFMDDERNNCYCRARNGDGFDPALCHRKVWFQDS